MNWQRVQTIIDKEWAEVFKNRLVLFTIILLPLIFTALPLGIVYTTGRVGVSNADLADMPSQMLTACGQMAVADCFQIYLLNQFMVLFMMMPLIIPIAIAAYSIVGEKTTRSLEPLLATPITTVELLTGKSVAATVPAVGAAWGCFIIFLILAPIVGVRPMVFVSLLNVVWLLAIFVAGPLMAVLAVNVAIIVSSRVNDPRAAEQIAAVVVVPLMGLIFGQIAGIIVLNLQFMTLAIGVLGLIDIGLIYVGARLFQRETILTKWK